MAKKQDDHPHASGAATGADQAAAGGQSRPGRWRAFLRWPYLLSIAAVAIVLSSGILSFTKPREAAPESEFQAALKLLDQHREQSNLRAVEGTDEDRDNELLVSAKRLALGLQEKGFQDRTFPGGVAFVLGMCAFRDAIAFDDVGRDQRYLTAAGFLREVESQSIPEEPPSGRAFATGISLYRIGRADEAQTLLKEAVETYPPGKKEAGLLLTQVYMDGSARSTIWSWHSSSTRH